jgi:hypothetical protein
LGELTNAYRILVENDHLKNKGKGRITFKMNLGEIGFVGKIWK